MHILDASNFSVKVSARQKDNLWLCACMKLIALLIDDWKVQLLSLKVIITPKAHMAHSYVWFMGCRLAWWFPAGHVGAPVDAAAWHESRGEAVGWSGWNRTWHTGSSGLSEGRRTTAWLHSLDLNLSNKKITNIHQILHSVQRAVLH